MLTGTGTPLDGAALFAPEVIADPFPLYERLLPETPLETSDGLWLVMRYDHVFAALSDHRSFSSARQTDNEVVSQTPILFEDPPEHTRHRKFVQPAFTNDRINALRPWIAGVVDDVVSSLPAAAEVDAVPAFCNPLPVRVIAKLMGVPAERHHDFKRWSDDRTYLVGRRSDPRSPEEAVKVESASRSNRQLLEYFVGEARKRLAAPLDDLITDLVVANDRDDSLTENEVAAACALVLTAGNVTTTNLLGNLLGVLADQPDVQERLRADSALVPAAVEESLRLDAPVQWLYRRATRDTRLGEATIPEGSSVIVYFGAANRDPAAFPDPDRFDLDRPPARHAAFGHGIHFCLGAPLGRLEAELALDRLLARFARIERGTAPAQRIKEAATHRGYTSLPLVFHE